MCRNLKYNEINSCNNCSLKDLEENFHRKCYNKNNEKCINRFINDFNRLDLCSDYCPLECDSLKYEVTHILRPLLATGGCSLGSGYENFITYENVTRTFFSIVVYFEDLKYTLITQKPTITFLDLIFNIGNILGLFISFTFITCLEIFEVFTEFFFVYFKIN